MSSFFVFVSCCFWHHCQRKSSRFGRIDVPVRDELGLFAGDKCPSTRIFIAIDAQHGSTPSRADPRKGTAITAIFQEHALRDPLSCRSSAHRKMSNRQTATRLCAQIDPARLRDDSRAGWKTESRGSQRRTTEQGHGSRSSQQG